MTATVTVTATVTEAVLPSMYAGQRAGVGDGCAPGLAPPPLKSSRLFGCTRGPCSHAHEHPDLPVAPEKDLEGARGQGQRGDLGRLASVQGKSPHLA